MSKVDSRTSDKTTNYQYSGRDRLVEVTEDVLGVVTTLGQFDYNHEGNRIRHRFSDRGNVDYFYDDGSVLVERNADDDTLLAHYQYADRLIGLAQPLGKQYYHHDALGSTIGLTDAAGADKKSYRLDPWGNIRAQSGTSDNRHIFTGQEHDTNTGLVYFGARYYDPEVGRFMTQDTYLGQPDSPPSLHRYQYAHANPTAFTDPTGNMPIAVGTDFALDRVQDAIENSAKEMQRKAQEKKPSEVTPKVVVIQGPPIVRHTYIDPPNITVEEMGPSHGMTVRLGPDPHGALIATMKSMRPNYPRWEAQEAYLRQRLDEATWESIQTPIGRIERLRAQGYSDFSVFAQTMPQSDERLTISHLSECLKAREYAYCERLVTEVRWYNEEVDFQHRIGMFAGLAEMSMEYYFAAAGVAGFGRFSPLRGPLKNASGNLDDAGRLARNQPHGPPVARRTGLRFRGPSKRHFANRVGQKSLAKELNTVVGKGVDVAGDVAAINAGRASRSGANFLVNGRTYGLHNGTLYPISGPGLTQLNRSAYKALGVLNKFGNTPQAARILNRMRASGGRMITLRDRIAALRVWQSLK